MAIFGLCCLFSCHTSNSGGDAVRDEVLQADREMSRLASEKGFFLALSAYADDKFVKLNDGAFPIIGKAAFDDANKGRRGTTSISWEPVEAVVSGSADLAYTWGNWIYKTTDTTMYGNYFSVWKRYAPHDWKLLLDGGNSTPDPDNKQ